AQGLSLRVAPHDLEEELLFRAEVPDDEGRIDARLRGDVAYRGARVPTHREERGCGFADRLPAGVPSRSHAETLRCAGVQAAIRGCLGWSREHRRYPEPGRSV